MNTLEAKTMSLRLARYRLGQWDSRNGSPCRSTNGTYLDGFYSPSEALPPFLTLQRISRLDSHPFTYSFTLSCEGNKRKVAISGQTCIENAFKVLQSAESCPMSAILEIEVAN